MGLDWLPGNKPKPGYEKEFEKTLGKLNSNRRWGRERLKKRFNEISISPYDTLNAPTVGKDENANKWALEKYARQKPDMTEEEWLKKLDGYRVVNLVPDCNGIPKFSNGCLGYVDIFSFRGDFLRDCTDITGIEAFEEAYLPMTSDQLLEYGKRLVQSAEQYAEEYGIDLDDLEIDEDDDESDEFLLDIVIAAGRWCIFWAERGHGLQPYY